MKNKKRKKLQDKKSRVFPLNMLNKFIAPKFKKKLVRIPV